MEFQRRPSAISHLSYSDTDLDLIDDSESAPFLSNLLGHSHFFAPVGGGRSSDDDTTAVTQRYSNPLILISPDTSTHNSTSSIPATMATGTTHTGSSGNETSPSPKSLSTTSLSNVSITFKKKPKKFSLNLNGHLSTSSGRTTPGSPSDSPEPSDDRGVYRGDQYINKERLAKDLSALSTMPELCDVTFLVGEDRQPICAVRAILAARSRVFRKMLYTDHTAVVGASKRLKKRHQQNQIYRPSDGYIEKFDFRGQPTVVVKDYEPEVFKQLIDYTHTGTVLLQARTLLGLMNAADHYCLEELKQACIRFMEHCITVDSVCSLLSSAEKYIQYKSTKILVQKIFEFVDSNAEAILPLCSFITLPQHIVRIVLSREELKASEMVKFNAAYNWCLKNSDEEATDEDIKRLFEPFVDVINYNAIPAKQLMQRIKPAGVVDDTYILTALAYQADPSSVPASKQPGGRLRRVVTPGAETAEKSMPAKWRRVQSSGTTFETVAKVTKPSDHAHNVRDVRAGSVPLNSNPPGDSNESNGVFSYLQRTSGSEVHPLKVHDIKERIDSQSSSHASILSTPPLSPTHSPSTASFQGSLLSASSSDSVPILSQDTGSSGTSSVHTQGNMGSGVHSQGNGGLGVRPQGNGGSGVHTQGPGGHNGGTAGNVKKIAYNPVVLDAIVNLSTNNAVEV